MPDNPGIVTSLLAVYGTLRRGHRNYPLIEPASRHVGLGHLPGRLVHVSSPLRRYSYPGYLPDVSPRAGQVVVEVVDITDPALWPSLDALERCLPDDPARSEYVRTTAVASMLDGSRLTCWTYTYNAAVDGYGIVSDGDWATVCLPDVTGP